MIRRHDGGRGIHSPGSGPCLCCYRLRTSSPRRSATRLPTPSQPEPSPRNSAGHRVRESPYFFFAFFAAFFFAAMLVLTPLLYQGQTTLTEVTSSSPFSLPSSSLPCLFSPPFCVMSSPGGRPYKRASWGFFSRAKLTSFSIKVCASFNAPSTSYRGIGVSGSSIKS
jgi:hypothetical protein